MQPTKILYIPDSHIPFEDKKAFNLMLKVGQAIKPDKIVILGDFLDCHSISDHDKNPNRVKLLDVEIYAAHQRLSEIDELGAKEKVFIKGNHEERLERYLMRSAPALYNLVRMEDMLKLKERGWSTVQYRDHRRIGKVYHTHDTGKAGQNAHRSASQDFGSNAVIGHTHRMEMSVTGTLTGDAHIGVMFGWLGDFAQVDYMHRIKALRDWVHGFGVGYMTSGGIVHIQPIPIIKGQCVVEGKVFG